MDLGAKLFYKCQFDVELAESSPNRDLLWEILLRLRDWLRYKHYTLLDENIALTKAKVGTFLKDDQRRPAVFFKSALYEAEDGIEWAGRLEEKPSYESDKESGLMFAPRSWITELSYRAETSEGPGIFSLILSYQDRPGFLGPIGPEPTPSVPRLVRLLTGDDRLYCSKSDFDLEKMSTRVDVNGAPGAISAISFWNLVLQSDREYPIVYVALNRQTGEPAVNPQELSDALYPNALVCVPTDLAADEGVQRLCPIVDLRCYSDSVRIYETLPKLRGSEAYRDLKRHRFFTRSNIERLSQLMPSEGNPLVTVLRQALSQDVHFYETRDFVSLEKVIEHKNEAELRERIGSAGERLSQYKEKLENLRVSMAEQQQKLQADVNSTETEGSDMEEMTKRLKLEKKRRLKSEQEAQEVFKLAESVDNELQTMRSDNEKLSRRIYSLQTTIDGLRRGGSSDKDIDDIRKQLNVEFPKFFSDNSLQTSDVDTVIAKFFADIYDDRIVLTERALRSLKECVTNPALFWQSMIMVCRPLWNAYSEGRGNIDGRFLSDKEVISGFEVALNEGSMTKKDPELMNKRHLIWNGQEYSIEPHLKKGNKDNADSIRIYYAWDAVQRKIVIGSIGKHIPNFTTKKGLHK